MKKQLFVKKAFRKKAVKCKRLLIEKTAFDTLKILWHGNFFYNAVKRITQHHSMSSKFEKGGVVYPQKRVGGLEITESWIAESKDPYFGLDFDNGESITFRFTEIYKPKIADTEIIVLPKD